MKLKLKNWQKILVGYISFLLIIVIVSISFYFLATSPDVKYGIKSGIIEHSDVGTDITESITGSKTAVSVLENDALTLSLTHNGNIELMNKQTGKVWASQVSEMLQSSFNQDRNAMQSFCELTYINDKNAEATFTSFDQCVQKKQLRIYKKSDDTVRLDYILGESNSDQLVPLAIEKERFEKEILPLLDESDKAFLKRQYLLYSADTLTAEDNPDELYKSFPKLKNTPLYIAGNLSGKVTKEKLMGVFEKIGYTAEDYDCDNELTGYGATSVTVTYKIIFDLTLDGRDLIINVPIDEIEFFRDYPLVRISLMRFFMSSANASSVLIPSGSGALVKFVPGQNDDTYTGRIYGEDRVVNDTVLPTVMDKDSDITLPMLAIREGENTVTAMIESGDANADIKYSASSGGMNCYLDFTVLQSDRAYINTQTSIIQCGNDVGCEDIRVRYRFGTVNASSSDQEVYSDIAVNYREYLKKKGTLKDGNVSKAPLLLLDIIGSVQVKKDFLGLLPASHNLILTDFEKAGQMIGWFGKAGADNLSVTLSGWNKGGLHRQTPGNINVLAALGGNSGLEDFSSSNAKNGISTYLSAGHTGYFNPTLFGGYSNSYTTTLVDGSMALENSYNAVERHTTGEGQYAIISPHRYSQIATDYIHSGNKALSIGDLASTLDSDYGNNYYDRTRTKNAVVSSLKKYSESGVSISVDNANMYALPFIDRIENVAVKAGDSSVFDSAFPLVQIVLHGNIDYTTELELSNADDMQTALSAIRFGSGLKATLSYSNSDYEFKSYYSYLFSTDYKTNRENIVIQNEMVKEALGGLQDIEIIAYNSQGEVSRTEYANGTVIYVNTGNTDIYFDTQKITAMSYLRIN